MGFVPTTAATDEGRTGFTIPGAPMGLLPLWALLEAYHQFADDPVIFDDPLALSIIGLSQAALAAFSDDGDSGRLIRRQYGAARVRRTDEIITASVPAGVTQVAILSPGLDTFAYRTTLPVHTWEVDAPETQTWKLRRLSEASIAIPETVRFVPVDPTTSPISAPLLAAGLDPDVSTIFVWLGSIPVGVTAAVVDVFRFVGSLPTAQIVFDYLEPAVPATPEGRLAHRTMLGVSDALGAPMQTFFTEESLHGLLRECGLTVTEDVSAMRLIARYAPVSASEDQWVTGHFAHAYHC